MIKKNSLLPLLLLVLLASACENEIPFNLKENSPKLVMNAQINADSLYNTLFLNITGQNTLGHVKEATVEIRVNGILTETAQPIPNDAYQVQKRFRITTTFHPGDLVRIDATTSDSRLHAWAEVTVPQPITIEEVDTTRIRTRYNGSYEEMIRFRFAVKDRPNEKSFYRLVIEQRGELGYLNETEGVSNTVTGSMNRFITGDDIVLTDGQPDMNNDNSMFEIATNIYGVFDDSRFTNQSYAMTAYILQQVWLSPFYTDEQPWLNTYVNQWWKVDVRLRLLSITETEYYYLKALNLIDSDMYDETMMEPIKFASNVNGGIGLISISTETSKNISLPKQTFK